MPEKKIPNELDRCLARILLERATQHKAGGRYRKAQVLLKTLVSEFPTDRTAREALIDLYLSMVQDYVKKKEVDPARHMLYRAHELDPNHPQIRVFGVLYGKRVLHNEMRRPTDIIRQTVLSFLESDFPEQIVCFDLAWRIFKDISPSSLGDRALQGSLGSASDQKYGREVAQAVLMVSEVFRTPETERTPAGLKNTLHRVGLQVGAEEQLIKRLAQHVVRIFPFP